MSSRRFYSSSHRSGRSSLVSHTGDWTQSRWDTCQGSSEPVLGANGGLRARGVWVDVSMIDDSLCMTCEAPAEWSTNQGSLSAISKIICQDVRISVSSCHNVSASLTCLSIAAEEHHVGVRVVLRHKDARAHIQTEHLLMAADVPRAPDDQLSGPVRPEPRGRWSPGPRTPKPHCCP